MKKHRIWYMPEKNVVQLKGGMERMIYDAVYLLLDIIDTYMVYKFMCLFYGEVRSKKRIEILTYIIFYVLSTIMIYINQIPAINMIYSLLAYFLIGLNYRASGKKRIFLSSVILAIMICLEGIVVSIWGVFQLDTYVDIPFTDVVAKIFFLILELGTYFALDNFKYLRNDDISLKHWLALYIIPILSLVIIVIFSWTLEGKIATAGSFVVFIINLVVFYLYNSLQEMMQLKREREVLEQQMQMYSKQYSQMEDTIETTRKMRHDMKNFLIQIEALADGNHKSELSTLMGDMVSNLNNQYMHSNTGNVVLDSILNYKLEFAKNKNIQTNLKIKIPSDKKFSAFDMTVLLGNLLDNAIEAAEICKINPYISIEIVYERNILYVKIENIYVVKLSDEEKTSKKDKQNHGIGLQSVKNIVEKYEGNLKVTKEKQIYRTEVWLPDC